MLDSYTISDAIHKIHHWKDSGVIELPTQDCAEYNARVHLLAQIAGYPRWGGKMYWHDPKIIAVAEKICSPYGLVLLKAWIIQLRERADVCVE